MKIAAHPTERVKFRWPLDYWREFMRKALDAGHEIVFLADEPTVVITTVNTKVSFLSMPDDARAMEALKGCDLFVGPPLRFYRLADSLGLKMVGLLGSSREGKGVRPDYVPCSGCHEAVGANVDCFWRDEICMAHITPNMVMEAVCGLSA